MLVLELLARGVPIAAVTGLLAWCAWPRSPVSQHRVLVAGLGLLLALPVQVSLGPRWAAGTAPAIAAGLTARDLAGALAQAPSEVGARPQIDVRAEPSASVPGPTPGRLGFWISLLYWLGPALLMVRLALGHWRVGLIIRRGDPVPEDHPVACAARRAARAVGLARPYRLIVSDRCGVPFTAGLIRAAVVVPPDFASWPAARRSAVLLHELAHVRRRDPLTRALADLACAVSWINPLAWILARRAAIASELACDDRVVAAGWSAERYARDLVALARTRRGRGVIAAAVGVGGADLGRRVARLMGAAPRGGESRWLGLGGMCLVAALGGGVASVDFQARAPFRGSAASTLNLSDGGPEVSTNAAGLQARWVSGGRHGGLFVTGEVDLARVLGDPAAAGPGLLVVAEESEEGLRSYQWPGSGPPPAWVRRALGLARIQLGRLVQPSETEAPSAPRLPGSVLVGTPARSEDVGARVIQAGWIEGGSRYGMFRRGGWRVEAGRPVAGPGAWLDVFRFDPVTGVVERVTIPETSGPPTATRNGVSVMPDGHTWRWVTAALSRTGPG